MSLYKSKFLAIFLINLLIKYPFVSSIHTVQQSLEPSFGTLEPKSVLQDKLHKSHLNKFAYKQLKQHAVLTQNTRWI